jgi:hypothetical protein
MPTTYVHDLDEEDLYREEMLQQIAELEFEVEEERGRRGRSGRPRP